MASDYIEFLDGPRKGKPMKVGKIDGDAYGKEVLVAYVIDGQTHIARYVKVTQKKPGNVIIPSNKYKYDGDIR